MLYRTHTCGELRLSSVSQQVVLAGWVQTLRKFGSLTFIDLRDRYGLTQLVLSERFNALLESNPLGREYVIQVEGRVVERSNKNPHIPTGDIEIEVSEYTILNKSLVPPFTILDDTDGGDDLRMKYRYLDLRRGRLQQNLLLRYQVNRAVREYLHKEGFIDIETPFLIKSTPEGARDFIVPSRMNPHEFYALPQSPQTFKQLLMVSGFDKYYQIVKCFRDEDLRADRQPEFTQIDCEMSFVGEEDVLQMFEGLVKYVFKEVKNIDYQEPVQRITWADAMEYYGNDKPDIRFDMRLKELTQLVKGKGFKVYDDADYVVGIVVKGAAYYTRKQMDELVQWVKRPQIGMGGLAYVKCELDGSLKSSFSQFFDAASLAELTQEIRAEVGDLILILAGEKHKTRKAMSELRLEMAERMGLRKADEFKLLWVVDFPLLEFNEEDKKWYACHHPFTSPKAAHFPLMDDKSKYGEIKANAYDLVLNGNEIGGGSIRIFQRALQEKMFHILGLSKAQAERKFGFLLGAFEYGAPPHGGIAFGMDRFCALLSGSESIRDLIAFPKNNSGRDVMLDAPSPIEDAQYKELHLRK